MKIIVLGATGMIGGAMLHQLSERQDWQVLGVARDPTRVKRLEGALFEVSISGYDFSSPDHIERMFRDHGPDVVINCVGLTKHLPQGNDPILAITMNALLPHRLAEMCAVTGARLIHISTDCVFSGRKGNYLESDLADASDIYGISKHIGEVSSRRALTLRTSTIGHESGTRYGLLEWFLNRKECFGYSRAVFSGMPTVEFANVLRDHVLKRTELTGLYHVGAAPIDKDSLLRIIAARYGVATNITASDDVVIDRSLNVERFTSATGYIAPPWPQLIDSMYTNHFSKKVGNV